MKQSGLCFSTISFCPDDLLQVVLLFRQMLTRRGLKKQQEEQNQGIDFGISNRLSM
jgi:hypothetical protein